ncbi:MAG: MoaD/ThiS family protein [Mucilaginibacter sp.]
MRVNILAFGIEKDIFGSNVIDVELQEHDTTSVLKQNLEERYPRLKQLASYMVAINSEYAQDDYIIKTLDEIAIIPPVSGG